MYLTISVGQHFLNTLVSFVLIKRVNSPQRSGCPADQRELQNEANNACNWAANGEKQKERQKNGGQ